MLILIILGIIFAIFLIAAFWITSIYNALVALRNRFKNAFAQIDVQLKRRYDLIPNLVETAKGYMKHERETLEGITKARAAAAPNPLDAPVMRTHWLARDVGIVWRE